MRGNRLAAAHGVDAFVGLAFTLTRSTRQPSTRASARESRRCAARASFGRSRTTVTSTFDDGPARARRRSRRLRASRSRPGASFQRRIGVRKVPADVAGAGGAEHRVDQRVTQHVAVGMPDRTALERNATPASTSGRPRPADAGRSRCRRATRRLALDARAAARSSGVVIFTLRSSPSTIADRMPRLLGEHRLVGRRRAGRAERNRVREHARGEIPAASARARSRRAESSAATARAGIDALDGVADGDRRAPRRRASRTPAMTRSISAGVDERPRRVVNQHHVDVCRQRRQPLRDGILPPRAAGHDRCRDASQARRATVRRRRDSGGRSTTTSCDDRGMRIERATLRCSSVRPPRSSNCLGIGAADPSPRPAATMIAPDTHSGYFIGKRVPAILRSASIRRASRTARVLPDRRRAEDHDQRARGRRRHHRPRRVRRRIAERPGVVGQRQASGHVHGVLADAGVFLAVAAEPQRRRRPGCCPGRTGRTATAFPASTS